MQFPIECCGVSGIFWGGSWQLIIPVRLQNVDQNIINNINADCYVFSFLLLLRPLSDCIRNKQSLVFVHFYDRKQKGQKHVWAGEAQLNRHNHCKTHRAKALAASGTLARSFSSEETSLVLPSIAESFDPVRKNPWDNIFHFVVKRTLSAHRKKEAFKGERGHIFEASGEKTTRCRRNGELSVGWRVGCASTWVSAGRKTTTNARFRTRTCWEKEK